MRITCRLSVGNLPLLASRISILRCIIVGKVRRGDVLLLLFMCVGFGDVFCDIVCAGGVPGAWRCILL